MDINSLLSPQDSPASDYAHTPSPRSPTNRHAASSRPNMQQRKSSTLSNQVTPDQITSDPSSNSQYLPRPTSTHAQPSFSPHSAARQAQAAAGYAAQSSDISRTTPLAFCTASPSSSNTPASAARSPLEIKSPLVSQPGLHQPAMSRSTSTPHMDTLADLASMQQHQQHHNQPPAIRSPLTAAQANAALGTTATSAYSPSPIRPSASRHGTGESMASMQSTPLPRQYATKSLSETDLQLLNQTSIALHDSSLNFQAHVDIINLLHKGFVNHVQEAGAVDGHTYELIADLRDARKAMDDIYPLGEDLWYEWINDEKSLARTIDDRINVMQLCAKAINDEPNSAKLWRQYGQYIHHLYASANELSDGGQDWSEDDRLVGKEVFTWASINEVWERAVVATQWRLNDSNIVWDPYMEILIHERTRASPSATFKVDDLQQLFVERLLRPHATWDQTFQAFSTFVSSNFPPDKYEELMATTNQRASYAKQMWGLREPFELKISTAAQAEDRTAELEAYSNYLTWEVEGKGVFSGHLVIALYERAVTRFPAEATLWEEYIEYLVQESLSDGKRVDASKLQVLERATRHCPWSGTLWSHRLLALEDAGKDFKEMESVKHLATKSGILELFGMEELLKVYIDWCGFLRRRAFESNAPDEDDLDIAEVGIKSALEHVRESGERMTGKDKWQGDPHYRLERIHIRFLSQGGNVDAARQIWHSLKDRQRNSYDFWYRWYVWEMVKWAKHAKSSASNTDLQNPSEASAVLKQALQNIETVDVPEQLLQMYLAHCEQYESVAELQHAHILVRKLNKLVQKRRFREHEEHTAQTRAYYEQQSATAAGPAMENQDTAMTGVDIDSVSAAGKRKFNADETDTSLKKQKTATEHKRDREHASIIIKKIPKDTSTTALRKFFRNVGDIVNITFTESGDESTTTATVEFSSAAEAEYAQTRHGKDFEGNEVEVSYAAGTTIWVTNYPPEADEKWLRDTFQEYGEIVDIRLPSLQGNTHRRFCYIQFATPSQALAATALEGKVIHDGKETLKLQARISDPSIKEKRQGAMYEGRELIVKQLHFHASEAELREIFSQHGNIDSVRIPKKPNGQSKGSAFVVFATAEEARAAAAALNNTEIRNRKITVEVTTPQGARAKTISKTVVDHGSCSRSRSRSGTPAGINGDALPDAQVNGTAASPTAASDAASVGLTGPLPDSDPDWRARKDRTLYLTNIPDTVNDARVRAFLEPYGQLRQITLRPDHQGAIVEFDTVADAGKAEMRIPDDRHEFVTGRTVRVVDEQTFRKTRPEYNPGKITKSGATGPLTEKKPKPNGDDASAPGGGQPEKSVKFIPSRPINRPGLGAGRGGHGGRRGGLGFKSSGMLRASSHEDNAGAKDVTMTETNGESGPSEKTRKSNDDFRAMLAASKKGDQ